MSAGNNDDTDARRDKKGQQQGTQADGGALAVAVMAFLLGTTTTLHLLRGQEELRRTGEAASWRGLPQRPSSSSTAVLGFSKTTPASQRTSRLQLHKRGNGDLENPHDTDDPLNLQPKTTSLLSPLYFERKSTQTSPGKEQGEDSSAQSVARSRSEPSYARRASLHAPPVYETPGQSYMLPSGLPKPLRGVSLEDYLKTAQDVWTHYAAQYEANEGAYHRRPRDSDFPLLAPQTIERQAREESASAFRPIPSYALRQGRLERSAPSFKYNVGPPLPSKDTSSEIHFYTPEDRASAELLRLQDLFIESDATNRNNVQQSPHQSPLESDGREILSRSWSEPSPTLSLWTHFPDGGRFHDEAGGSRCTRGGTQRPLTRSQSRREGKADVYAARAGFRTDFGDSQANQFVLSALPQERYSLDSPVPRRDWTPGPNAEGLSSAPSTGQSYSRDGSSRKPRGSPPLSWTFQVINNLPPASTEFQVLNNAPRAPTENSTPVRSRSFLSRYLRGKKQPRNTQTPTSQSNADASGCCSRAFSDGREPIRTTFSEKPPLPLPVQEQAPTAAAHKRGCQKGVESRRPQMHAFTRSRLPIPAKLSNAHPLQSSSPHFFSPPHTLRSHLQSTTGSGEETSPSGRAAVHLATRASHQQERTGSLTEPYITTESQKGSPRHSPWHALFPHLNASSVPIQTTVPAQASVTAPQGQTAVGLGPSTQTGGTAHRQQYAPLGHHRSPQSVPVPSQENASTATGSFDNSEGTPFSRQFRSPPSAAQPPVASGVVEGASATGDMLDRNSPVEQSFDSAEIEGGVYSDASRATDSRAKLRDEHVD